MRKNSPRFPQKERIIVNILPDGRSVKSRGLRRRGQCELVGALPVERDRRLVPYLRLDDFNFFKGKR